MADSRRRFRNKKRDDHLATNLLAPVTIARRSEDPRFLLPKILLKKDRDRDPEQDHVREREREKDKEESEKEKELDRDRDRETDITSSGSSNHETPSSIRTIIINRTTNDGRSFERCHTMPPCAPGLGTVPTSSVCSALVSSQSSSAPNSSRDRSSHPGANSHCSSGTAASSLLADALQPSRMTRPTPLVVANGLFNANARKLFYKTNTDFVAIGVLGGQGSGKSTLLNLLTTERPSDFDYYQNLLGPEAGDCTFSTRHKANPGGGNGCGGSQKSILRPRTEALQFFITRERHILIDTPPLLSVSKESDHLDMHSVSLIAQLLSVCHVLVLVIDGMAVEQLRLLTAAMRLRPRFPCKGYVQDHLPQVLFVRNRARRQDFDPLQRERMDTMLAHLYEHTGLPIYRGRGESRCLNTYLLPEMLSNGATAFHNSPGELARQFREVVLGSTRSSMCNGSEISESIWFELLAESARKGGAHFEKIHGEIKQRHLDARSERQWRTECSRNET
ncbi:hypothetical protein KR018_004237 [Drosophila ironensis]|nr:hypothetical protein KR018_004237 [Drosophila ironensis]